jgi:hypothetical protein
MNWFAIAIISLFFLAGAMELSMGHSPKAMFYILSAAINASVMFLK